MDNLLSYKQKINKRCRQQQKAIKITALNPFPLKQKKEGFFRLLFRKKSGFRAYSDKAVYRPMGRSDNFTAHKSFKNSAGGQYIILSDRIIRHIAGFFKKTGNKTSLWNYFLLFFHNLQLKSLLSNGFIIAGGLGIIITTGIFSSTFTTSGADLFILPRDSGIDTMMENFLAPEDESGNLPFGDVNLSLIKGFTIRDHVIAKGESLSVIADKYNVDLGTIISFNNIRNARKINSGTLIKIPDRNGLFYKVTKGDSLSSIASKFSISLNDILDINNINSHVIKPGQELFIPGAKINSFELKKALGELFIYPVSGRLTSPYGLRNDPFTGKRRMHYGIDMANSTGTPVRATLDGKVSMCGYSSVYGKYIIIKHQGGYQSLYAHLDKYRVREGETIYQNQIIGDMGNSGRSTGSHLHFSIYYNQKPIDPVSVLGR